MADEADDRKRKKAIKKEKKERRRLKKEAKKEAKRARKAADDGSSSGSSSDAETLPSGLPQAAKWKAPDKASVPLAGWNESSVTQSRRPAGPVAIRAIDMTDEEMRARADRATRFAVSAAEREMQDRRAMPAPAIQAGRVHGQSTALEKSYLRLTALPRADEVRPLPVLADSFRLVQRRWEQERDYPYACEQLKSIRQDLTVQHLASDGPRARFALAVYEYHARLALMASDGGEFGQCQAQLVPLHAAGLSTHAAEFGAYRLLHCMAVRGSSVAEELRSVVGGLRREEQSAPAVAQALRMVVCMQTGAFGPFFAECTSGIHNLGASLVRPLLHPLRERALRVVCAAFLPSLPLSRAADLLGFAGDAAVCRQWLRAQGAVLELPCGGCDGDALLLTRATAAALRAQAEGRDLEVGPAPPSR
jgi:hypothetical protein